MPHLLQPPPIVGKKRDLGILDPMIFSGKIRKNTKNQDKYFVGEVEKKLRIRKNTEKQEKYSEKQEKYSGKFGKIVMKKFEIRKNNENSEILCKL